MEMTVRWKIGKPNAGFPIFQPPLEIPEKRRDFHIPTAATAVSWFENQEQQQTKCKIRITILHFKDRHTHTARRVLERVVNTFTKH